MRTVVFDLDGTLADTSADLIAAANACFAARGLGAPLDPVADALIAFHGGRAMLKAGYERLADPQAEAMIEADYPRLLTHYAENICVETVLYPGAAEAVEALRGAGIATAICTNKPEGLARDLVARLGIADLFGALIGADTLPTRKPDPAPYRAAVAAVAGQVAASCLIGDTETDRKTAAAVGVPSVLVTFGPEGRAIERLAPEALLDRYADLPGLAVRLLG
ncbi:HAD hydrolase-like protein [Pseudothioclava arenosa]|uniref:phosphoglycolate phosphatase n=1 Tax=Pseudothioclava arenosa TaxID=1795308 RepID=A0A2A4CTX2_9RHOB|nr:HAD hydrolase-like protein [Pseudothioclava arenosa]PCD77599.1 haloacid dehalogenase [Pseudothioclava arenosa]